MRRFMEWLRTALLAPCPATDIPATSAVDVVYFDARHKVLANNRAYVLALGPGGGPVGLMSIEKIGDYAWLNDLFVEPTFRRQGIAARMVEMATVLAPSEFPETTHCGCGVQIFNTASRGLFHKMGFAEEREYSAGVLLCARPHVVEPHPVEGVTVASFGRGLE